ncbi:MAG TPA: hypothetical protein VFR41_15775 [Acidimicrobiia bacterium]|nr:hypothetical protein [Acidimicrobiia bacterium]
MSAIVPSGTSRSMRVELGPVSSASARAWIEYATDVLAYLRTVADPRLAPRVLDAFESFLDEWRPIATRPEAFRWTSDDAPERVQYLVNALYLAGTIVEDEAAHGRVSLRPAIADEFHVQLVRQLLDALERQSTADAHFVHEIRDLWSVARRQ